MSGLKAALTRKFGPLPAWGWAGILGGALLWYRSHTASASASGTSSSTPDTAEYGPYGESGSGSIDGGSGDGGGSSGGGGPTTTSAPPVINVTMPGATSPSNKRKAKAKPQHKKKVGKFTISVPKVKRSKATTKKAGRTHPKSTTKTTGKARDVSARSKSRATADKKETTTAAHRAKTAAPKAKAANAVRSGGTKAKPKAATRKVTRR